MRRSMLVCATLLAGVPAAFSQAHIPANAVPNTLHYRQSGVADSTGRDGSAVITSRALLGKDHNTTVELTTGALDTSTPAPGSFVKVQYKPLTSSGTPLLTANFDTLTGQGYYSFTSSTLYRGQQVQLQSNVTGIDPSRTDVVTIVDAVKLRPDVTVKQVTLPSSANVNHLVNISANLLEMNGDTSATTTCLLAVDGTNVDQGAGVYIDAGGSVSCTFAHTFTTVGKHTVQVTASNVLPADWDTSNNAAAAVIDIVQPNTAEHAESQFTDTTGDFPVLYQFLDQTWQNGVLVDSYSQNTGSSGEQQSTYSYFWSSGCAGQTDAAMFQFPASVTYTESMDGSPVYSIQNATVTGSTVQYSSYGNNQYCNQVTSSMQQSYGSVYTDSNYIYLSSYQYLDNASNPVYTEQSISVERYAGDVTYFSTGYQCNYWSGCDNSSGYYSWNSSGHNVSGTLVPLGSVFAPSITVQDATGNAFGGSLSVPLSSTQNTQTVPYSCSTYSNSGYTYNQCYGIQNNETSTSGFVQQ